MSCDGDVDEIVQLKLAVKSNWLTSFLEDDIDISTSKLYAIEAGKTWVLHLIYMYRLQVSDSTNINLHISISADSLYIR